MMDLGLSPKAYRKCLLRSSMLNFLCSEQGQQSLGFLYSILPGLRDLHRDDRAFAQSCARYARHFKCHSLWAPFLAGAFLRQERQFAAGGSTPDPILPLQRTLLNSLSALGDSFFNGSLLIMLALGLACLAVLGWTTALGCLALSWFMLSLLFKWFSFHLGLARGFPYLRHVWRLRLADKAAWLKCCNALLLCLFLVLLLRPEDNPASLAQTASSWFLPVAALVFTGGLIARLRLPRLPLICAWSLIIALL